MFKLRYKVRLIFDFLLYLIDKNSIFPNEYSRLRTFLEKHSLLTKIERQSKKISYQLKIFADNFFDDDGELLYSIRTSRNRELSLYTFYMKDIFKKWKKLYVMLNCVYGNNGLEDLYSVWTFGGEKEEFYITREDILDLSNMVDYCSDKWNILRLAQCNQPIYKMMLTIEKLNSR